MQFKDVHWQLYAYIDFSFVLCTKFQLLCMYQNKHLITQKNKASSSFFTPKWKLLNRKAISPQTDIADSSQSVFKLIVI